MQKTKEVVVSVIMPVYNAEKYLRETLDTVVGQSLKEIEIICVDDGSTDESRTILREYADKDNRITVLTQQNQFAGVARNAGLAKAKGKYVIFWDADDLFDVTALEKMSAQAQEDEADICVCGANQLDNNTQDLILRGIYLAKASLPANRPFAKEDMPQDIFRFSTNVPWNKLFCRAFLEENKLQFQDIKQANDTYFVIMALFFAKRITYVGEKLITYRLDNADSLTGKASDANMCAYRSYEKTREALLGQKDFVDSEELQRGFANRAFKGFLHSLYSQRDINAYTQLYQFLATKGFEEFGLTDKDEAYFLEESHYSRLQSILTMQPDEFLLLVLHETQGEMKRVKSCVASQNQEIKRQQVILTSLTVRTALKVKKILTFNNKLRYKK